MSITGTRFSRTKVNASCSATEFRRLSSKYIAITRLVLLITLAMEAPLAWAAGVEPTSAPVEVQLAQPPATAAGNAPLTLTFKDALERARANDVGWLSALTDSKIAHEDRVQARDALLPSVSYRQEYLGTQGNGKLASGRYVTNDGVHVYRVWGVFHEDLSANNYTLANLRHARAAEALAEAKAEVARRGLAVTVTKAYYALVSAQRKYATAQRSLDQAQNFFRITSDLEKGGEVARSDVIKAQIQLNQQQQAFQEAKLAMEAARLDLAVLLFRDFDQNFAVVDDLDQTQALPTFAEIQNMAQRESPDIRAALEGLRQSSLEVAMARQAFLPSMTIDTDYGIESNIFALRGRVSAAREAGRLPNVGYFLTATLNLPVWDWGTLRSKVRQARLRRDLAKMQLSFAQRQRLSNLYAFYDEAAVAGNAVATLRSSADLAAESLRLTTLRYQAGEATVLEVVDAQTTLTQARNAFDDGQVRYRMALAQLQTLTGNF